MFATPAVTFHTLLSLVAILAGIFVMSMLVKNRRPDVWTLVFLVTMIATDVTGFLLPAPKLLPVAHHRHHLAGVNRARAAGALPFPFQRGVALDLRRGHGARGLS